jgi:hypothetical protein
MLAAVLYRARPHDARLGRLAIATFTAMLDKHAEPDGSFGPAGPGEANNQISTMVAGTYLATAFLEIGGDLSPSLRTRWQSAIHAAAIWLIPYLTFYVNGNINLGETAFEYMAYRATGDSTLLAAYARSLAFTLAPTGARWQGFGLHYTKLPRRTDGADGSGYLAESGRSIGFDTYYTYVQAGYAALLYAISRSAASLRLLNLLTNQLLAYTDRRAWLINISTGTRRGEPGKTIPFVSPALDVAAIAGGRADLLQAVGPQFGRAQREFRADVLENSQAAVIADYATAVIALEAPLAE